MDITDIASGCLQVIFWLLRLLFVLDWPSVLFWWTYDDRNGWEVLRILCIWLVVIVVLMGLATSTLSPGLLILLTGIGLSLFIAPGVHLMIRASKSQSGQEARLRAAIETNPENATTRRDLARYLHRQGRLTEALEQRYESLRRRPQ